MMRFALTLWFLAIMLFPLGAQTAQEKEWIAHCVAQISETNKPRAQKYCACMAESIDPAEKLRQTDLERSYPPLHRMCFEQAGFKAPN